jgi:hypothetical protein
MIQICAFKNKKKKEVKKNPNLVANGRFQCLVALGGEGETSFSHFSPNKFYLNLFFPH